MPVLNGPDENEETLDNLYESLGRLLWTETEASDSDLQRLFPLHVKRASKHDLANQVVSRLEEIVQNLKEINRWNSYTENNHVNIHNPAGPGLSYSDGDGGSFLLNKRTPDSANVLMCLLCSQNTHICDARQFVRACYPSARGHRIE